MKRQKPAYETMERILIGAAACSNKRKARRSRRGAAAESMSLRFPIGASIHCPCFMEVAHLLNKYRVHEVAKDFGKKSNDVADILTKYATAPKNHMQVLEDRRSCPSSLTI